VLNGPPVFAVQKLLAAQGFQPFSAFRHIPLYRTLRYRPSHVPN